MLQNDPGNGAPPLEFSYEALLGRVVFGAGAVRRELATGVDRLGARVLLNDADDPARRLREVSAELSIPAGPRELGTTEEQFDEAAELVEPADNPCPVDRAALREIIHAAWAGTPPATAAPTRE
ncbi:MAG: hypothetical protein J2P19_08160 [Pseudonocardia sp.]|nr:hypothetical protein [Pseudonocardia sp.]